MKSSPNSGWNAPVPRRRCHQLRGCQLRGRGGSVDSKGAAAGIAPAGDDWRVVGWPFKHRADAERARAMLVARGLRVDLVEF